MSVIRRNPGCMQELIERDKHFSALKKQFFAKHGRACQRCKTKLNQKRAIIHHRHYRTYGREQLDNDVKCLCRGCHQDLHDRHKSKRLNCTDIPFVDPQWENWLKDVQP